MPGKTKEDTTVAQEAAPSTVKIKYVGASHRRIVRTQDFADLGIEQDGIELVAVWCGGDQRGPRVAEVSREAATWLLTFETADWAEATEEPPPAEPEGESPPAEEQPPSPVLETVDVDASS